MVHGLATDVEGMIQPWTGRDTLLRSLVTRESRLQSTTSRQSSPIPVLAFLGTSPAGQNSVALDELLD